MPSITKKPSSKKIKRESPERNVIEAMLGKKVQVTTSANTVYRGVLEWVDMFSIGIKTEAEDELPTIMFKGNLVSIQMTKQD